MACEPASRVLQDRIRGIARALGTMDPTDDLAAAIDCSFDRPLDDEAYAGNALQPGALPFEWSFSEAARESLRLDFEPCGQAVAPADRRYEATRYARRIIGRHGSAADLRRFDSESESWRRGDGPDLRFGAFFGASVGPGGLDEVKVYYEAGGWNFEAMPARVREAALVARASVPGLSPLLCSVSWARGHVAQRVYWVCRDDLRLLDLAPFLTEAGLGHRVPDLIVTARALSGGTFVLPAGTTVLALREIPDGLEVKLEIVVAALALPQDVIRQNVRTQLRQRPESLRAYDRWLEAVARPAGRAAMISVASIRVGPQTSSRLSVYVRLSAAELAGANARALAS